MTIDARELGYKEINEALRGGEKEYTVAGCLGQRFIGAGMGDLDLLIEGVPGNALGAYLNGAKITVRGNAQDAVGDTMSGGVITVHGNVGDAGYRAGIHMKAYKEKVPVIVIGGKAGSFLGEYQAGGVIVVLGLSDDDRRIVGNFPCTGMHGGKMILRSDCSDIALPDQVTARAADADDLDEIRGYVAKYCAEFGADEASVMDSPFTVITPNTGNPYKRLYVAN